MNSVVNNVNRNFKNLGKINFNSQEEILEAHQVMINQLRDNTIKLAKQNNKLFSMVEKLYSALETANIEIPKSNKQ